MDGKTMMTKHYVSREDSDRIDALLDEIAALEREQRRVLGIPEKSVGSAFAGEVILDGLNIIRQQKRNAIQKSKESRERVAKNEYRRTHRDER